MPRGHRLAVSMLCPYMAFTPPTPEPSAAGPGVTVLSFFRPKLMSKRQLCPCWVLWEPGG